jgi:superoxide reductase
MNTRRDFFKLGKNTLPVGVASLFLATGVDTAAAEVDTVGTLLGQLPKNIVYSKSHEGIWKGKAGSHVPKVSLNNGLGRIVNAHGMSPQHYIVRHTLLSEEGEVLFGHTFAYDDDQATSEFDGSKVKSGKTYYALSFCNKHDLWLAEIQPLA